jgi:galactose-1-phosphate uridylyltransferase
VETFLQFLGRNPLEALLLVLIYSAIHTEDPSQPHKTVPLVKLKILKSKDEKGLLLIIHDQVCRNINALPPVVRQEEERQERLVVFNADWLALVPYWAVWPYETMIIPRNRHILRYGT